MTKDEMKEVIRQAGVEFRTGLNKDQLQEIIDRIHVHRTAEPTPPPDEPPTPPPPPELDADGNPIVPPPPPPPELDADGNPVEPPVVDAFGDLLGKIKGAEIPKEKKIADKPLFEASRKKSKKGASSPDSMRVEGYVLMLVVDTVFPAGMAFLNNMLDKRVKIQAHQLALTPHDFAKLEPLADQAADYLAINLNPVAGFFLIASFMYGNNLINLRMEMGMKTEIK